MKMWLRLGLDQKRNPGWKCGMRIADTGMRVADSGMGIAENVKSGPVIIWDLSTPENTVDTSVASQVVERVLEEDENITQVVCVSRDHFAMS